MKNALIQTIKYIGLVVITAITFSFQKAPKLPVHLKNSTFDQGETLKFRMHYGFLTAGEAVFQVSPKLYKVNNKVCYRSVITGKSSGSVALIFDVKDSWISYIDTTTMMPEKFYRNINENSYKLKETVYFDQTKDTIRRVYIKKDNREHEKRYKVPLNVHDILSGYHYFRNVDYSKFKEGDEFSIKVFFEDTNYDFRLKYRGKDKVRTKVGKINSIVLSPIVPDNDLFEGGESIRIWLSDDKNRIPLKAKASMFVGSVEMDLKSYKGVKYPINFVKK